MRLKLIPDVFRGTRARSGSFCKRTIDQFNNYKELTSPTGLTASILVDYCEENGIDYSVEFRSISNDRYCIIRKLQPLEV